MVEEEGQGGRCEGWTWQLRATESPSSETVGARAQAEKGAETNITTFVFVRSN